jgi:colanic acid biosynthesis glycosyl transferase WcaI
VGEAGKPPARPAARVQHQPAPRERPGHQLEQRTQDLLAHRDVARVAGAPRSAPARVLLVARVHPLHPRPLRTTVRPLPASVLLLRATLHPLTVTTVHPLRTTLHPLSAHTLCRHVRVLLLTHYYPPELGAAPARIAALAHGLADRGVQVTVHTGFPHYPSGTIPPPYRNRPVTTRYEGPLRVVRSIVYPTPNRGFGRRLANHTVFAAGALVTSRAAGPVDVVVAETPPLFTAAAGVAYARLKGAQLVLNVSDLWPESAIELGVVARDGRAASAAGALAQICYRSARLVTAPTEGIVATLDARSETAGKVVHVPPAVDLERFAYVPAVTPRPGAPLRVLYAGTLGLAQGLDTLVQAAALAGPEVVELLIAGEGPEREHLDALTSTRGLAHVRLLGPVAAQEIPALYGTVDAGVVTLRDLPIFTGALPTKLFEVLAAGRPVILAARGEAAQLVRDADAGLVVAPEDSTALAHAFDRLRASPEEALQMGSRGRLYARRFDRPAVVEQWLELLTNLTGAPPATAPRPPESRSRA